MGSFLCLRGREFHVLVNKGANKRTPAAWMPGRSLSKPKDEWKSYKKPPPCVATYSAYVSKIKYDGVPHHFYFTKLMTFEFKGHLHILELGQSRWQRSLRRDDKHESDDRSPLVSRSNPGGAAFAFSFAKLRKRYFR